MSLHLLIIVCSVFTGYVFVTSKEFSEWKDGLRKLIDPSKTRHS